MVAGPISPVGQGGCWQAVSSEGGQAKWAVLQVFSL